MIFKDGISIELWFGYNLFLYKRFEFNFEEYQKNINEQLKINGYDVIYTLNLNYLNNINIPDAGILPMKGGNFIFKKKSYDKEYYFKYIKYKEKYLKLKMNNKI